MRGDATTWVIDGSVSTAGADMNLVTTTITAGQPVQITLFTLTLTSLVTALNSKDLSGMSFPPTVLGDHATIDRILERRLSFAGSATANIAWPAGAGPRPNRTTRAGQAPAPDPA